MNRMGLLLAVLMAWPPILAQPSEAPVLPLKTAAQLPSDTAAHGVWQSVGYGWILALDSADLQVFHDLGSVCLKDTGQFAGLARYRLTEPDQLEVHHHDFGERTALLSVPKRFQRLSALPALCQTKSERLPARELFNLVTSLFTRRYAGFGARQLDWPAHVRSLESRVETVDNDDALFDLLGELIAPLEDGHVGVWLGDRYASSGVPGLRQRLEELWRSSGSERTANEWVSAWHRRSMAAAISKLEGGSHQTGAAGALEWGYLSDSVGYLRINRFAGFAGGGASRSEQLEALEQTLDRAFQDLSRCSNLVVDVAMNGGGFDAAALVVASRFTEDARRAFSIETAQASEPRFHHLYPTKRTGYRGAVYLLTSEITASAAEGFVLAMRAIPGVVHVGGSTRGGLSGILSVPLPNGMVIKLAAQKIRSVEGEWFEGKGITPHREIPVFGEDPVGGMSRAIEVLLGEIRSGEDTTRSTRN